MRTLSLQGTKRLENDAGLVLALRSVQGNPCPICLTVDKVVGFIFPHTLVIIFGQEREERGEMSQAGSLTPL